MVTLSGWTKGMVMFYYCFCDILGREGKFVLFEEMGNPADQLLGFLKLREMGLC